MMLDTSNWIAIERMISGRSLEGEENGSIKISEHSYEKYLLPSIVQFRLARRLILQQTTTRNMAEMSRENTFRRIRLNNTMELKAIEHL